MPIATLFSLLTLLTLPILFALSSSIAKAMPAPGETGATDPAVSESTGAAQLEIPIEVPPGAGGLTPKLVLRYSSHQGDGPYGVGWDLNLGEIRCSQRFGVPDYEYSSCPRFEHNGQLLTRDGASDRYHGFVETFGKVEYLSGTQTWEVTHPNGTIQRYGVDPDARVFFGSDIARWLLSEVEDPFGNILFVSYDDTTDPGTRYPVRITYGADATKGVGTRSIEILFGEDRPDPIHDYLGGIEREVTKRLTDIEVLSNGILTRRYAFGYEGVDASGESITYTTGRSRLSWVQEFGADCPGDISACIGLPRQEYVYTDSMDDGTAARFSKFEKDLDGPENFVIDFGKGLFDRPPGIQIADVNGDGLSDVIEGGYKGGALRQAQVPGVPINNLKVRLNTGMGFVDDPDWTDALGRLQVERPRADFVQRLHDLSTGGVQEVLHLETLGIIDQQPNSVQYTIVEHRLDSAAQPDMVRPEAHYSMGVGDNLPAGGSLPGWIEAMGRTFFTDVDADGLADIVVSVRLSGVDKVLDAQGVAIPSALVQREPGLTIRKVYRNSGDPSMGWIEDDDLARGLPAFGVVQFESDYGAESRIPFGLGPDPSEPISGYGVPGSGLDVTWSQSQIDACSVRGLYGGGNVLVPEAMAPDVCINLIDLAPRFVDFNGDGFLDLMVLDLEDPTALHQGQLFSERGNNAQSVAANKARSQVWLQVPDAAPGEDRWIRASQYDLPNVPFRSPADGGLKAIVGPGNDPWSDDEWILFAHAQPQLASGAAPPPGCPGSGLWGSDQWEFCAPLSFNVDTGVRLVDLNRDGLTDIIWSLYDFYSGTPDNYPEYPLIAQGVLLNTGTGWCSSVFEMSVHVESYCPHAAVYNPPASDYPLTSPQLLDPAGPSGFGFEINRHVGPPSGHLVDLNADGYLDYIQAHNTKVHRGRRAWLFDPAGLSQQPPNVWVRDDRYDLDIDYDYIADPPSNDYLGFALFDVDGDGAVDIVGDDLSDPSGNQHPQVFLSKSKHSDLIRLVRNGTGGETSIAYESAIIARDSTWTNPPGSADLESAASQHAASTGETLEGTVLADVIRWNAIPVVSEVRISAPNRAADPATPGAVFGPPTKYRYAHPRYCTKSRSSLGFRVVERTRPGGETVTHHFYQVHGRAGRTSQVVVSEAGVDLHSYQEYWETQEMSAQLPPPTLRPAVPANQAGSIDHPEVFVGRLARTESYNIHPSGPGAIVTSTYSYDEDYGYGYNFVEKIVEQRPTGTMVRLNEPISDFSNSIFGLVSRQKLLDHVPSNIGDEDFLKDTAFAYEKGRRSSITDRVKTRGESGAGTDESHTLEYDDYGNLTKQTAHAASGDQVTDFCFDGDEFGGDDADWCPAFGQASHSIRVGILDAAGGLSSFEPDPLTGAIVETGSTYTDEPGTRMILDAFGRPIESFVHDGSTWQRVAKTVYDDLPFLPAVVTRFTYAEAGDSDAEALWSSVVSDGFGDIWKEIGETPTGFVGTATYYDPSARIVRKSLPVDCGGDASCASLDGAGDPSATATQVDAIGRRVYSETPHGFSIYEHSSISSAAVMGPWSTSNGRFDRVLEKNGKGDLVQRGFDGDRVAWVDECENTALPSDTDLSSTSCLGGGSGALARTFYRYEGTGELAAIYDPRIDPAFSDPNHRLEYQYDTLGRIVETLDPALAGSGRSQSTYDSFGNLLAITNARLQTRTHTYDSLNRLTSITTPTSETDYVVDYRADERKSSGDSSDDYQRTITFDGLGRVQKEHLAIRSTASRFRSFHTDFSYDLVGRVREILYPAKHFNLYGWRDTVVRYEYDGEFLEQVCELGGASDCDSAALKYVTSADFDSLGRLSAIRSPAGTRRFEYTTNTHRLSKDEFISPAYQYTRNYVGYDGVGNIESITGSESASQALDMNETYVYDQRNRIEQWVKSGSQMNYGYDNLGNLTTHAGDVQIFDDPTRPYAITRRNLTESSPTVYAYDDDGNALSIVGESSSQFFAYDSANQIVCLGDAVSSCETRIVYDINGKRVAEYPAGQGFIAYTSGVFRFEQTLMVARASLEIMLDGKRIALKRFRPQLRAATTGLFTIDVPTPWITGALAGISVLLLGGVFRKSIIAGVRPRPLRRLRPLRTATALTTISLLLLPSIAFSAVPTNASPPTYYWEIADSLGTGMVLLSQEGKRVRHQVFTPFGEVHDQVGGPFRTFFGGHRRDEGSGLYYMQARWYDPGSGGFLSADPLVPSATDPQSLNAYAYARNNPLNFSDPDGQCWRAGISCGIQEPVLGAVRATTSTSTVIITFGGNEISRFSITETVSDLGGQFGADGTDLGTLTNPDGSARRGSNGTSQQDATSGRASWLQRVGETLGRILAGEIGEIFGSLVGTIYGIGAGLLQIGKGILGGDLAQIGQGLATVGSALVMPRAGSHSGLGWPGTPGNVAITPGTGTKLNRASIWHDKFTSRQGFGSAAQFEWIRRAWTGPGAELGPFGQAYRLTGTVGFGVVGAIQAAAGF